MANIKFMTYDSSKQIVLSKGIRYPLYKPIELTQAVDRDAGGGLQVEDLGLTNRRLTLRFTYLTQIDYNNLETWYLSDACGALNKFYYYDENGTSHVVRWLSSVYDLRQTRYGKFAGELLFEVVP